MDWSGIKLVVGRPCLVGLSIGLSIEMKADCSRPVRSKSGQSQSLSSTINSIGRCVGPTNQGDDVFGV